MTRLLPLLLLPCLLALSLSCSWLGRNYSRAHYHLCSRKLVSQPQEYPAVSLDTAPIAGEEQARLERMLLANRALAFVYPYRHETDSSAEWERGTRNDFRIWRRADPHPYLSKALPGVAFYSVEAGRWTTPDWAPHWTVELVVATRDSSSYVLPEQVSQLLVDTGWRLDESDAGEWVKVHALVWSVSARWRLAGRQRDEVASYVNAPYFPKMTVDSVRLRRYPNEAPSFRVHMRLADSIPAGFWAYCSYNGPRGVLHVTPNSLQATDFIGHYGLWTPDYPEEE